MEDIIRLVEICHKEGGLPIDFVRSLFPKAKKLQQLHFGLVSGHIGSRHEALNVIYAGNEVHNRSLDALIKRLKTILLNSILSVSPNLQNQDISKAFARVSKDYSIATNLLISNEDQLALKILRPALSIALKYELTNYSYLICKSIIPYVAKKEGLELMSKIVDLTTTMEAETLAEIAYFSIKNLYENTQASVEEAALAAIESKYSAQLEVYSASVRTHRFLQMYYLFKITMHGLRSNQAQLIKYGNQCIEALKGKPFFLRGSISCIRLKLLIAYIKEKRHSEAFALIQKSKCEKLISKHHVNLWSYYEFISCCHFKDYDSAYAIVVKMIGSKKFKKLPEELKQLWLINHAFADLFFKLNKVNSNIAPRDFRLYKFLNEVPVYSKDKRGLNILILITRTLHLIDRKKHSQAHHSIESLLQYGRKYLVRNAEYRLNCMIKLLGHLSRADFNVRRAERYAEPTLSRLNTVPLSKTRQELELEIIPFEDLWEISLELCTPGIR